MDDWEVNTAERGDQNDRGGYRYRGKQYSDQREKRPFEKPSDQFLGLIVMSH
jgi:hypothetical protein